MADTIRLVDPIACPCGGRRSHDLRTGEVGSCGTCDDLWFDKDQEPMVPDGPNDEGGGNTPEELEAMFAKQLDALCEDAGILNKAYRV